MLFAVGKQISYLLNKNGTVLLCRKVLTFLYVLIRIAVQKFLGRDKGNLLRKDTLNIVKLVLYVFFRYT